MINIHRAKASDRLMKALTGLTVGEFSGLVRSFSYHLTVTFTTVRKVNPALGTPPTLKTAEEKLFYRLRRYVLMAPTCLRASRRQVSLS